MATVLKKDSPVPQQLSGASDLTNLSSDRHTAVRQVTGLAGFNLNDLADQGRAQLDACRAEVRRMLADADATSKQVQIDAEKRGYEAGTLKAEKDIDKRVSREAAALAKQQLALLNQTVAELRQTYDAWMSDYHAVLNTTALEATRRVVGHRLDQDATILINWVAEALQSTRAASKLTVAVHPEVLAELGQALDELVASSDLPESTTVIPDETLGRTEVSIRQTGGEIRAGLATQLDRLAEALQ